MTDNCLKKILTYEQLPKVIDGYRAQNKKIVLTQGTFDLVHIGHGRYLKEAKDLGEVLFVGVDSDTKVKKRKGPQRPIVPETERCEILTYFGSVDHVIVKPLEAQKWSLIKIIRPDVLVATSQTYTKAHLKELKEFCKKVVVLKPKATTSTSAKIRRMQIKTAQQMTKALATKLQEAIDTVLEEVTGVPTGQKTNSSTTNTKSTPSK
jgi:D-beta-D-heptose 7-phosphate kinase/D-beta-D-heptose 1-phosphate adenosyltransferase